MNPCFVTLAAVVVVAAAAEVNTTKLLAMDLVADSIAVAKTIPGSYCLGCTGQGLALDALASCLGKPIVEKLPLSYWVR